MLLSSYMKSHLIIRFGGDAMKNKVIIEVSGREYTLVSVESEDYVRGVAAEVSRRIEETQYKSLRVSKQDAAILTCLDLCDENFKLQQNNDNMREQILGYIDEIAQLNKKLARFERQRMRIINSPSDEQADKTGNG